MYNWITRIFNQTNQETDNNKYGLQMSLTLSTHPFFEKYRQDVRGLNQIVPRFTTAPWYYPYKCDIPKGRQDFPTIIVRGNQSCDKIYLHMRLNLMEYERDNRSELREAILDESFHGNSIYVKDPKYKELDPSLFKPFKFDTQNEVITIANRLFYWNVPMVFIGFDNVNKDGIYDLFIDILKSNPIGKDISSIDFLKYMSQPVVFWVKWVNDEKERSERDGKENEKKEQLYDRLEYKIMSNIITDDLFKLMRDSYLESIGRKLLNSNKFRNENYLEPEQSNSIH